MRELIYVLADGTETKSMRVAKESGQAYTVETRATETEITLSPIRQAMLNQFGYVSSELKDKVAL